MSLPDQKWLGFFILFTFRSARTRVDHLGQGYQPNVQLRHRFFDFFVLKALLPKS
jgi:hypothetical protein